MREEILKAVRNFSELKVIVIGDIILDEYLFGDVERISPEAPVPVVALKDRKLHLGGAANVAVNLRTLGAQVELFGVIGDDEDGKELLALLHAHGIDGYGVVIDNERPTTKKTRVVSVGQQMIRLDKENTSHISEPLESTLLMRLKETLDDTNAVIIQDYNKGVLTPRVIDEILKLTNGKLRAVDPKMENFFLYRGVEIFKPNMKELERVTGRRIKTDEELKRVVREIKRKMEIKYFVVTRGERGSVVLLDDTVYYIPALKREVFDVTGAGDTVISVLVLGVSSGLDILKAAVLSSIAAGIEVGKFGTAAVYPDELMEVVEEDWNFMWNSIKKEEF